MLITIQHWIIKEQEGTVLISELQQLKAGGGERERAHITLPLSASHAVQQSLAVCVVASRLNASPRTEVPLSKVSMLQLGALKAWSPDDTAHKINMTTPVHNHFSFSCFMIRSEIQHSTSIPDERKKSCEYILFTAKLCQFVGTPLVERSDCAQQQCTHM